jgi:hypothetical protein
MSLTEIMSRAGLTLYPIVALVLFLFAFAVVLARVLGKRNAKALEQHAHLPLEDDTPAHKNGGAP